MDPRPPKPSTQQPPARQAGGIGIRAASRFGQLVLAIAAIGPSALLDLSPGSTQAHALRTAAERLSQRLGAIGGL